MLISIFLSSTEKQFTSTAVFEISESKQGDFNISPELGTLASLAGFGEIKYFFKGLVGTYEGS